MAFKHEKHLNAIMNAVVNTSAGSSGHIHSGTINTNSGGWVDPNLISNYSFTKTGTNISSTFPQSNFVVRCVEHTIEHEVEMLDGSLLGTCADCGETIKGRRLAGGLGLEHFKMVLEGAIQGDGLLAEEILRLQQVIATEAKAVEDARVLLRLAEAMLVHQDAA